MSLRRASRGAAGRRASIALALLGAALATAGCRSELDDARADGGTGHVAPDHLPGDHTDASAGEPDAETDADAVLDSGEPAATPRPLAPGSYEITGAEPDCSMYAPYFYVAPWMRGTRFRLDLLSTTEAVVWSANTAVPSTVRFGPPASDPNDEFSCVKSLPAPLIVEPTATWRMFIPSWTFEIDEAGMPTTAQATVAEAPPCGQAVSSTAFFVGRAQVDRTAPSFAIASEPWLEGLALPWDGVALGASEGLDADAWQAATTASLDDEPVALIAAAVEGTPEVNRLALPARGWSDRNGRVLRIEVASGVRDGAGNAADAASLEQAFADVGSAVTEVTFDGAAAPLLVGMETRAAGDSPCEPDAPCAVSLSGSAQQVAGLAVRLDTQGAETVRVRFFDYSAPVLETRLVLPSGEAIEARHAPPVTTSNWREVDLALPEPADEVGLTLRWKAAECTGGPRFGIGEVALGSITVR